MAYESIRREDQAVRQAEVVKTKKKSQMGQRIKEHWSLKPR